MNPTPVSEPTSIPSRKNRVHVLILQHPQEPDKVLGSARLAHQALENSTLKIALSVANLKKALGRDDIDPTKWGVLYLGSGAKMADAKAKLPPGLTVVKKNGEVLPALDQKKILEELEGFIVLDGTWSQAKALWWRNAWLLKLKRMILQPAEPSLYGSLRKEPRRECLSTIESIAECLRSLGEDPEISTHLRGIFSEHLAQYRKGKSAQKSR